MQARRILLSGSLAVLAACGGGGGGDDPDVPFFAGVYRVNTSIVEDTCGLADESFISATHTVNQNGNVIVLDVLGGGTFSGAVNETGDGFSVSGPVRQSPGCETTSGIAYARFDGRRAGVAFGVQQRCPGIRFECRTAFAGEAVKQQ